VVAVHRRYLHDPTVHAAVARTLETRIEVPTLTEPSAIAAIVGSRVRAHLPSNPPADVVGSDRGAVLAFQPARFLGPSSEPDVRLGVI